MRYPNVTYFLLTMTLYTYYKIQKEQTVKQSLHTPCNWCDNSCKHYREHTTILSLVWTHYTFTTQWTYKVDHPHHVNFMDFSAMHADFTNCKTRKCSLHFIPSWNISESDKIKLFRPRHIILYHIKLLNGNICELWKSWISSWSLWLRATASLLSHHHHHIYLM